MLFAIAAAVAHAAVAEDQAAELSRLAAEADSFIIDFYAHPNNVSVRFTDPKWSARLAAALRDGKFEPKSHCMCISYPIIYFLRGSDIVVTISVHHVERLRVKDERKVNRDFQIGRAAGQAIIDLAMEKKNG